jgi:hypothetical protein
MSILGSQLSIEAFWLQTTIKYRIQLTDISNQTDISCNQPTTGHNETMVDQLLVDVKTFCDSIELDDEMIVHMFEAASEDPDESSEATNEVPPSILLRSLEAMIVIHQDVAYMKTKLASQTRNYKKQTLKFAHAC